MPRCKPGDLAIVISAFNRTNVGRIVEVLRLHDGRGHLAYPHVAGTVWLVRDVTGRRMVWRMEEKDRLWRRIRGPVPDGQLQPIRGEKPSLRKAGLRAGRLASPEPAAVPAKRAVRRAGSKA